MNTKSKTHRESKKEKSSRSATRNNFENKKTTNSHENTRKKSHQPGFYDSDNSHSARPIGFDTDLTTPGVL